MKTRTLATVAIVLLILIVGIAALYAVRSQVPPTAVSPTPTLTTTATVAIATSTPVTTATPQAGGAITGRFGYGSDFIPPVTVYAISTTDQRAWYSVAFPGFGNPPRPTLPPGTTEPRYTISGIAPGAYWVVAYRNDGQGPDPGLYSRVNECFRTTPSGPCPDGTLVPAAVIAGQTTSGIDILTWGYPPPVPPSPTIPPRPTPSPVAPDSGLVNVCGAFNAYMPASSGRNAVLSMGTPNGLMNFELVLSGTVPPDLQQNGAQLVRLTGRRVQGINTVADYNVARVSSCSAP